MGLIMARGGAIAPVGDQAAGLDNKRAREQR